MDDFPKLWKEFIKGTKSLNYRIKKENNTPSFYAEVERFKKNIIEPMDVAFKKLNRFDQADFWAEFEKEKKVSGSPWK